VRERITALPVQRKPLDPLFGRAVHEQLRHNVSLGTLLTLSKRMILGRWTRNGLKRPTNDLLDQLISTSPILSRLTNFWLVKILKLYKEFLAIRPIRLNWGRVPMEIDTVIPSFCFLVHSL
jgi:hypothetical protein